MPLHTTANGPKTTTTTNTTLLSFIIYNYLTNMIVDSNISHFINLTYNYYLTNMIVYNYFPTNKLCLFFSFLFMIADTVNCNLYWQVEIKNLNSFSSINRAIDFEIARQALLYSQGQGDQVVQETRLWEEGSQVVAIPRFYFGAKSEIYHLICCSKTTYMLWKPLTLFRKQLQ